MQLALPTAAIGAAPPRAGGVQGGWRLTRVLGRGQYSTVYRAAPADEQHAGLGDFVVKAARPGHAGDPLFRALLRREAVVSRMVRHANLTSVLADRSDARWPFLVLPYLDGVTAQQLGEHCIVDACDREVLLPLATASAIVRQLAQAAAAMHERGWIHSDIAPANVLIASSGHTTLLDLGLARRIESDECQSGVQLAGTPGYLPPELHAPHGRLSPAADVYTLGLLLFELAAGRPLFDAADAAELARLHRQQAPSDLRELRPSASSELAELVRRMLAKEPLRRPSAEQIARWLAEIEIAELATGG
jgi:serine/threonine-protein kinase